MASPWLFPMSAGSDESPSLCRSSSGFFSRFDNSPSARWVISFLKMRPDYPVFTPLVSDRHVTFLFDCRSDRQAREQMVRQAHEALNFPLVDHHPTDMVGGGITD